MHKSDKIYTVNQSIWIAAAAYAYSRYRKNTVHKLTDIYLSAPQLQRLASEYTDNAVQSSRIHQHCNGDHASANHRFVRKMSKNSGNADFRVVAGGEFGGDREYPDDLNWEDSVVFEGETFKLQELLDFVQGDYVKFVRANVTGGVGSGADEIDYIGVMEYLDNYREIPYSDPEREGISQDERKRLLEVKAKGQAAVAEMKKMASLCKDKFHLDRLEPMTWLNGARTKTREYLWAQMKYGEYADSPISISVFVYISPHSGKAAFRYSLEIRNEGADKAQLDKYYSFLDLPLKEETRLTYLASKDGLGQQDVVDVPADEVKKRMDSGVYGKVQLCRIVERQEGMDNADYRREMIQAIEALLPFYEYVIDYRKPSSEFYPLLKDYDPGITEEEYERILGDESTVKRHWLDILYFLHQMGGEGTCKQVAARHGKGAAHYNTNAINIAKVIARETGCPLYAGENGENRYWPILFFGKDMPEGSEEGIFCYKMREPLTAAIQRLEERGVFADMGKREEFDKNMILYGPPGTGKTYHTVLYAVAICDGKSVEELTDYGAVMERYRELKAAGRIAFTTFHQSYGYEEFIEGIKPVVEEGKSGGDVTYKVEPGAFKRFCECKSFEEAWNDLVVDVRRNGNKYDFSRRTGTRFTAELMNNTSFRVSFSGKSGSHIDISKEKVRGLFETSDYEDRTGYPNNGNKWLFDACFAIADTLTSQYGLRKGAEIGNRVFIIDEINRGNISKIFGELITLIESSKRKGMPEEASVILPYSGEEFSVPGNVYILGTMNTADRSIALMDTALRRRFQFIEKMPDTDVLKGIVVEGLDVSSMLAVINQRIEFLYDREHTIGHAFFMGLREEPTLNKLAEIFSGSVIPLLQEYFYEDYRKIQLVLGDNGKRPEESDLKFIREKKIMTKDIFVGSVEDIVDLPEMCYQINPEALRHIESYKKIAPGL